MWCGVMESGQQRLEEHRSPATYRTSHGCRKPHQLYFCAPRKTWLVGRNAFRSAKQTRHTSLPKSLHGAFRTGMDLALLRPSRSKALQMATLRGSALTASVTSFVELPPDALRTILGYSVVSVCLTWAAGGIVRANASSSMTHTTKTILLPLAQEADSVRAGRPLHAGALPFGVSLPPTSVITRGG